MDYTYESNENNVVGEDFPSFIHLCTISGILLNKSIGIPGESERYVLLMFVPVRPTSCTHKMIIFYQSEGSAVYLSTIHF